MGRTAAIRRGFGMGYAPSTALVLTSASDGGWTHASAPQAVYYSGRTYFGYVDGTSSNIEVKVYTHATRSTGSATVLRAALFGDNGDPDTHNAPSLLIRDSDHKLIAVYSAHNGAAMYRRISTNSLDTDPTLSGGFAAESNIDSSLGGSFYTYPILFQQLGETNDPIYLFYRDAQDTFTTGVLAYSKSTDGGSTWAAQTELFERTSYRPYWKIESDGQSRFDVFTSDGRDETGPFHLYHFYYDAGTWKQSDGSTITSPPFNTSELTEVDDSTGGSAIWPLDSMLDSGGAPIVLYEVNGTPCSIRYGRWDGLAWDTTEIVQVESFSGGFAGGGCLDRGDANAVYVSDQTSGQFEIVKYLTADSGATFSAQSITAASSQENFYPVPVHNRASDLRVLWLNGTFASYSDFQLGVRGTGV